jgi:hypothetical protein
MKRLITIFLVAFMAALATVVIGAEAREYRGPERGKMSWSRGDAVAFDPRLDSAFKAASSHSYVGPERGKMGAGIWSSRAVEARGEMKPDVK